jgi:hypothetical protein
MLEVCWVGCLKGRILAKAWQLSLLAGRHQLLVVNDGVHAVDDHVPFRHGLVLLLAARPMLSLLLLLIACAKGCHMELE